MSEYLFIGGHADGKRIPVEGNPQFVAVPVVDCETAKAALASLPVTEPLIESYVRVSSTADECLYVLAGISVADALRMLIGNYRPLAKSAADELLKKYASRRIDR